MLPLSKVVDGTTRTTPCPPAVRPHCLTLSRSSHVGVQVAGCDCAERQIKNVQWVNTDINRNALSAKPKAKLSCEPSAHHVTFLHMQEAEEQIWINYTAGTNFSAISWSPDVRLCCSALPFVLFPEWDNFPVQWYDIQREKIRPPANVKDSLTCLERQRSVWLLGITCEIGVKWLISHLRFNSISSLYPGHSGSPSNDTFLFLESMCLSSPVVCLPLLPIYPLSLICPLPPHPKLTSDSYWAALRQHVWLRLNL